MKYLKRLGPVALAIAAMMVLAAGASATVMTSPAGTKLEAGAEVKLSSTAISWDGTVARSCTGSTMAGKVSSAGSASSTVTVPLSTLTFTGCGTDTTSIINAGTLEFHATSGGNGTVTWTGAEMTVQLHRTVLGFPITTHCIYKTNATDIGTFSGSSTTKGTAKLEIGSSPIPQAATDGACGEDAVLTGNYTFTSPDYLDADLEGFPGTTLTSPAGTTLGAGAKIKAESEGAIEFAGTVTFNCQKSALEGEVSSAGGKEATVTGSLSSLSFSECGNHTVSVLKPGSLEIHSLGSGKGTLTSTGAEITVLTHGVFLGTRHCIYTTNKTDIGTITGSSVTGATAALDIGPAQTPQVATDATCGENAEWGGSYKVTSPDYLDVD
jgi:hypothetical protein